MASSKVDLIQKGGSGRMQTTHNQNSDSLNLRGKRKAGKSPTKYEKCKRSALTNLTNIKSLNNGADPEQKRPKDKFINNGFKRLEPFPYLTYAQNSSSPTNKTITRVISYDLDKRKEEKSDTILKIKGDIDVVPKQLTRRISSNFNKTEESIYISAPEDVSICEPNLQDIETFDHRDNFENVAKIEKKTPLPSKNQIAEIPDGVIDFDKLNWRDPFQVSNYAMDIFNYLKSKEVDFQIDDYMTWQRHLSKSMRSMLVDWMVEVQETFELNHETLYLAVKIVDLFLCKVTLDKDKLQLLGATSLFIACKFDERTPPLIEDFLYICDGAYEHAELIEMEMKTLRTIGYNLGVPLSYRFLRRYSRCAQVPMRTLTLARFILELSLIDYETIRFSDSKLAAAALFIALRMHGVSSPWTATLEYYTGYKKEDFVNIVAVLNLGVHRKPKGSMKTIRNKYSHKIFHEVAKTPLVCTEQLLEESGASTK